MWIRGLIPRDSQAPRILSLEAAEDLPYRLFPARTTRELHDDGVVITNGGDRGNRFVGGNRYSDSEGYFLCFFHFLFITPIEGVDIPLSWVSTRLLLTSYSEVPFMESGPTFLD